MSNIYLLDDFKTWITSIYTRPSNYISWLKDINSKFIDLLSTGKNGMTPMDILEKLMTSKSGPKLMAVEELLVSIQSAITNELKIRRANTTNYATFENEQSAFNKYVSFILSKVKSGPYRKTDLTQSETAVCKHITGEKNYTWKSRPCYDICQPTGHSGSYYRCKNILAFGTVVEGWLQCQGMG